MRLDATTPELVKLLGRYGYAVHHPVECEISDQRARIAVSGGRHVIVTRNDQGGFCMEYETALPPAPEQLNYYDLLSVAVHLDRANDRLTALWHDVLGKPAFKDKAAEYANDLNNLRHLQCKVSRILQAERKSQRQAELHEAAP